MRRTAQPFKLAIAMLLAAAPVAAQDLPKADALFKKAVEAQGGAAVIEKHSTSHMVGSFSMPAQNITGTIETFSAAGPIRMLNVVDISGMGSIRTGYDGTVGWTMNPASGNSLITGKALDQLKQQADQHAVLHPEQYFASMETVEKTQFGGKDTYKVKLVTKTGETYHEFFDAATGLMAGMIRVQESEQGALEATTILEDYKSFDGQMIPMKIRQSIPAFGVEQIFTISTVEFKIADSAIFALPKEIQALVK